MVVVLPESSIELDFIILFATLVLIVLAALILKAILSKDSHSKYYLANSKFASISKHILGKVRNGLPKKRK